MRQSRATSAAQLQRTTNNKHTCDFGRQSRLLRSAAQQDAHSVVGAQPRVPAGQLGARVQDEVADGGGFGAGQRLLRVWVRQAC